MEYSQLSGSTTDTTTHTHTDFTLTFTLRVVKMNHQEIVDMTASSPAAQAEDAPPSSPLPEEIPATEMPHLPPPRTSRRPPVPAPVLAPLQLRWDPAAEQHKKHRAGPTVPTQTGGGSRKLTEFFGPTASTSAPQNGSGNVAGSQIGGRSVDKKRIAEEEAMEAPASKKARKEGNDT